MSADIKQNYNPNSNNIELINDPSVKGVMTNQVGSIVIQEPVKGASPIYNKCFTIPFKVKTQNFRPLNTEVKILRDTTLVLKENISDHKSEVSLVAPGSEKTLQISEEKIVPNAAKNMYKYDLMLELKPLMEETKIIMTKATKTRKKYWIFGPEISKPVWSQKIDNLYTPEELQANKIREQYKVTAGAVYGHELIDSYLNTMGSTKRNTTVHMLQFIYKKMLDPTLTPNSDDEQKLASFLNKYYKGKGLDEILSDKSKTYSDILGLHDLMKNRFGFDSTQLNIFLYVIANIENDIDKVNQVSESSGWGAASTAAFVKLMFWKLDPVKGNNLHKPTNFYLMLTKDLEQIWSATPEAAIMIYNLITLLIDKEKIVANNVAQAQGKELSWGEKHQPSALHGIANLNVNFNALGLAIRNFIACFKDVEDSNGKSLANAGQNEQIADKNPSPITRSNTTINRPTTAVSNKRPTTAAAKAA